MNISLMHPGYSEMHTNNREMENLIFHRNINKNDQYDQDLTCMVEGCVAIGEEVIALLDEASLSDVDEYDEHRASHGNNFKNKKEEEDYDLIPAIVCGKHFDMLITANSDLKEEKNNRVKVYNYRTVLAQNGQ